MAEQTEDETQLNSYSEFPLGDTCLRITVWTLSRVRLGPSLSWLSCSIRMLVHHLSSTLSWHNSVSPSWEKDLPLELGM